MATWYFLAEIFNLSAHRFIESKELHMSMTHLVDLRTAEFNCVRRFFRSGLSVLEIGGGTGFQASLIARTGATVESIDVAFPSAGDTYYPVQIYDGKTFPFPDKSFDVVFSSNVLEHIPDLEVILSEIQRVVKPDGCVIHVVPTSVWRIWTSFSHYLNLTKRFMDLIRRKHRSPKTELTNIDSSLCSSSIWGVIKRTLIAGPHGESPSAISELWYFSRWRWRKLFERAGFGQVEDWSSGIFYTGYSVFPSISIEKRQKIAGVLGSATRIFILRKIP